MKETLEKRLSEYQGELAKVEQALQNNLNTKQRLIGAMAATQQLLEDLEPEKKKKK